VNSTTANEAVNTFVFFVSKRKKNIYPSNCLVMGRLANRLLRYFKDCWSECQPMTPQLDDDEFDDYNYHHHRDNPLKRRLNDSTSGTTITRDKNNNTRPRKNYRQLAGLSDDDDNDDEAEYVPAPSSKRVCFKSKTVSCLNSIFLGSSFEYISPDLCHYRSEFSSSYRLS